MWILVGLCCTILLFPASADDHTHKYEKGEAVRLWANKLGPFNNPLETYSYWSLPFCPPFKDESGEEVSKWPSLGEALQGDELTLMQLAVKFRESTPNTPLCTMKISVEQAEQLHDAIAEHYWYQIYVDDLPMWASVGKMTDDTTKPGAKIAVMYLHQNLSLGWNGDRVVVTNLTAENPQPVPMAGGEVEFTYSVTWVASEVTFERRFRRYLDHSFFEHKIHWFSIFNSFMMVVFLAGLVFGILSRTLKADYQRYTKEVDELEEDREFAEDSGWKQVHADVFRTPPFIHLFCAVIGTGHQLLLMGFAIIFIAIASVVYTSRGALLTYGIVSFAITSFAAGFFSGGQYAKYTQISPSIRDGWIQCMLLTALIFPGVCVSIVFVMNFIAIGYHSQQAIPFGTMVVVMLLWALVSLPLVVLGTVIGRHHHGKASSIPRVSQIPRLIPQKQWYMQRWLFIAIGGLLPFGSIFIELYFVFTSFWNYKFYYVYGFMLLVFVILTVVTMCVAIVSTYFLLNAEDHRWPWTSFLLSASTSVYMYIYAIYFFFFKTKMTGLLMTTFYFGYMFLFCFGVGIMCGTIGFVATQLFVRSIYLNIKLD